MQPSFFFTSAASVAVADRWRSQVFLAQREAICMLDREGCILDANPAFAALLGQPLTALMGQRFDQFPSSKETTDLHLIIQSTLLTDDVWQGEIVYQCADGIPTVQMATAQSLTEPDGTVAGVFITHHSLAPGSHHEVRWEERWQQEHQARQAAEDERSHLQAVLEALPAGIAIYDAQGQMTQQNIAGEHLTRRQAQPGELPEERHLRYSIRRPDGTPLPEPESPSGRARRGETFSDLECIIDGAHGLQTHLLTSGAPLRDAAGQISGAIVVYQDNTALRQAEQDAQMQRALADAMVDSTPFGIALYDASDDFICLRHNAPFLALVGAELRKRGSIVGVPLDDLFDEDSRARVRAVYETVRATHQPVFLDEFPAVLLPDPTPRWYKWSLSPLLDVNQQVTALINSATEITDAVLAREAAQQQAAHLSAILDVLPVGVTITDPQGAMLQVNREFEQIWGASPLATSPANSPYQGWWSDGRVIQPGEWTLSRAFREDRSILNDEIDILAFDGQRKTILNAAAPVRNIEGAIIGGVAAALDITARRMLEHERFLAQQAAAEAQLLALAQTNEQMSDFLGIASHELRTPLTSLKVHIQIARRKVLPLLAAPGAGTSETYRSLIDISHMLERSEVVLERLNRLVSDLVDSLHIETDTLRIVPAPCDLVAIVRDAVEEQRLAWPARTIHLHLPGKPLPLVADGERISQVVTNYLTNALKYSSETDPVEVRVGRHQTTARVIVRDHGPGLPPAEQLLVWQRFHRAAGVEVLSGSGVGLGLGLHICATIIARHQGQVGIKSVVGEGAAFWFTVPLAPPPAPQ